MFYARGIFGRKEVYRLHKVEVRWVPKVLVNIAVARQAERTRGVKIDCSIIPLSGVEIEETTFP